MNIEGIVVGAAVFLIVGVCHPIVIKMEYYYWANRADALGFEVAILNKMRPFVQKRETIPGILPLP